MMLTTTRRLLPTKRCHLSKVLLSSLRFDPQTEVAIAQWMKSSDGKLNMKKLIDAVPHNGINSSSLEEYLDQYARHLEASSALQFPSRHAVNQLLSYPLSLSFGLQQILSHQISKSNKEETRITVVGARAEAALPIQWWRHALFSLPSVQNISIRFIGPGLNANGLNFRFSKPIEWKWDKTGKGIRLDSDINKDSCVLHEHSSLQSLLDNAHIFVLFNPGVGSLELREKWRPSLEQLLSTKKPILCTALSPYDLECDLKALQYLFPSSLINMLLPPGPNPYASTLVKQDGENRPIASNHSLYIMQGK